MSSIGDIILTTPVIRQLRERFPHAQIDYLIRREYQPLLSAHPHISNLLVLDVSEKRPAIRRLRHHIKNTRYDVILDLHDNFRSRALCRFPGRPPVLKIRKNRIRRFLLVHFKWRPLAGSSAGRSSVPERYLRAALPLGVDIGDTATSLHLPADVQAAGSRRWRELQQAGYGMVMAPGARHFTKRWPLAYAAELIEALFANNRWKTLLVGGPEEVELISELRRSAGEAITTSLAGRISLLETAAIIRAAPLFISNDSGLMHVAAAFGVPQVALFGGTTPELGFLPVNARAHVVEESGLRCRPCSHIGRSKCPRGHFHCMVMLTPERVQAAISKLQNEG